jgi:hypothetical protein
MDLNRHLIWNFCKRFSLNMPQARIAQPLGETTYLYMAPQGETTFPDITVKATAKAANGIAKVEFYDGKTLLDSAATYPYATTVTAPKAGKHTLTVKVTDKKDKTAQGSCLFNYVATQASYNLSQHFKNEGTVPQDWYVSNGTVKRVGGGLAFADGCRLLHFTNTTRGFEYGLLVQNNTTKEKAAWAKFGVGTARSTMTLYAGRYAVKYKVANWNQPALAPVTVAIEDADGKEVASQTYTPTSDIGGDAANKFKATQQTFEFDIAETGDYVLVFYADAAKKADFVLGQVSIQAKAFATGISEVRSPSPKSDAVYDLGGRRVDNGRQKLEQGQLKRGIYIVGGRKTVF